VDGEVGTSPRVDTSLGEVDTSPRVDRAR